MMKKITTLMVMLLCCILGTVAQTVASSSTPLESLQSGYYVMQMKVTNGKTDANGNFIYYDADDNKVHFDEQSSTDHDLRSTTLAQDAFKYVFHVENNNGTLKLKAYATNYYWPLIPQAQKSEAGCAPGDQMSFVMGNDAADYTYTAKDDWYFLQTKGTEYTKNWLGVWKGPNTIDIYVKLNESTSRTIGYWHDSGESNRCQFQFYAVDDMPEPGTLATITYEYTYNGTVRGTSTNTSARIGYAFPNVSLSGLPDFLTASKPEGTVEGDATIEIPLKLALPFEVSTDGDLHYYYLDCAKNVRLYNNSGLKFRTTEQAATVNGVQNDLWYVTGNPFDGFQFHNVATGKVAQSAAMMSNVTYLAFGSGTNANTWDLFDNGNGFYVCPRIGQSYYNGLFTSIDASNQKKCTWRMDDDGGGIGFKTYEADNDAFTFNMIAPTFTYTLYDGGDGHTYNTFSAPFDVKISADGNDDVKAYKGAVNYEKKELTMEEVNGIPANAGALLMGTTDTNVTLEVTTGIAALEGNDLVGNTADVTDLSDKLILGPATDDGTVGFFAASDGVNVLYANHAYLLRQNLSDIEGLSISFDGNTTGINHATADKAYSAAPVYDLTGRRVTHTVKGHLYIKGGRKFIAQ